MATQPKYTDTVNVGGGKITVANTNRDGTGTVVLVWTALAGPTGKGSRCESVVIQAMVTTAVGMVRLFRKRGGTFYLWKEIEVYGSTVSASMPAFRAEFLPPDPLFAAGEELYAATHNAEEYHITVNGGDFTS